ncbi:hypothetical protein V8E53_000850 [Lactarius tabidus]
MVVPSLGGTDPPATLCSSTALRSRESGALPHLPWYFRFDFGEIVAVVGAIRHYYARPTISAAVLRTTNLMPAQRHCGLVPFVLRLLLRRNVGNVHFFFSILHRCHPPAAHSGTMHLSGAVTRTLTLTSLFISLVSRRSSLIDPSPPSLLITTTNNSALVLSFSGRHDPVHHTPQKSSSKSQTSNTVFVSPWGSTSTSPSCVTIRPLWLSRTAACRPNPFSDAPSLPLPSHTLTTNQLPCFPSPNTAFPITRSSTPDPPPPKTSNTSSFTSIP